MIEVDTSHRCRRSQRCANPETIDEPGETPIVVGAITTEPDTLCWACTRAVRRAVRGLPTDYVRLETMLGEDSGAHEVMVSGSTDLPVPLRLDIAALQGDIDLEVTRWAEPVAEMRQLTWDTRVMGRTRPAFRIKRASAVLAFGLDALIGMGPVAVLGWCDPVGFEAIELDGVEAALLLLDLHRRAWQMAHGSSGTVRLPLPCPSCETRDLVMRNLDSNVRCRSCGGSWLEAEYQAMWLDGPFVIVPEQRSGEEVA